jgi:hypothetical protein
MHRRAPGAQFRPAIPLWLKISSNSGRPKSAGIACLATRIPLLVWTGMGGWFESDRPVEFVWNTQIIASPQKLGEFAVAIDAQNWLAAWQSPTDSRFSMRPFVVECANSRLTSIVVRIIGDSLKRFTDANDVRSLPLILIDRQIQRSRNALQNQCLTLPRRAYPGACTAPSARLRFKSDRRSTVKWLDRRATAAHAIDPSSSYIG